MKRGKDPLWAIVGEEVRLQGGEKIIAGTCPKCSVNLEIPEGASVGARVRCGVCGTVATLKDAGLVLDDGSS